MPRRELLSEPLRLAFTNPATDERGMVRHYTLSGEDLALIDRRRGDPNRLGFAIMLCICVFRDDHCCKASTLPAQCSHTMSISLSCRPQGKIRLKIGLSRILLRI
jgi:TnpA family transposase